mmetsp:Transcript_32974/g.70261  ORF Transcript_32974/g.70261 Transcript_32974/m.70261 type:complete len:105 (+) Transcript_32974:635-949(+)
MAACPLIVVAPHIGEGGFEPGRLSHLAATCTLTWSSRVRSGRGRGTEVGAIFDGNKVDVGYEWPGANSRHHESSAELRRQHSPAKTIAETNAARQRKITLVAPQ